MIPVSHLPLTVELCQLGMLIAHLHRPALLKVLNMHTRSVSSAALLALSGITSRPAQHKVWS